MSEAVAQATHGSADHPLRIGELELPCYVLEDGRRVLSHTGMIKSLGMSFGTASRVIEGGDRLTKFAGGKALQPYISEELLDKINNPIKFRTPAKSVALGYEATILADICEAVLQARAGKKLQKQQEHIAHQCEILMRGFARVGIIALVDEATGYQDFRARQALEQILKKFISAELMKWQKTFPDEFYKELFRLQGIPYSQASTKRPGYIGRLTNDIVYSRLAPGVLDELKRLTPKDEQGRRKHKFFQRLTANVGHPQLREHLTGVIALMKAALNYDEFHRGLVRAYPVHTAQLLLPLDYDSPSDE